MLKLVSTDLPKGLRRLEKGPAEEVGEGRKVSLVEAVTLPRGTGAAQPW